MKKLSKIIWDWLNNREYDNQQVELKNDTPSFKKPADIILDDCHFEYEGSWWDYVPDDKEYKTKVDDEIKRHLDYQGDVGK